VLSGSTIHSRHCPAFGAWVGTDFADQVYQYVDTVCAVMNEANHVVAVAQIQKHLITVGLDRGIGLWMA
jgi:hypothetical protein